jgi:hypothetical protein
MQTIGGYCKGTNQATMTYRDVLAYRESGVSARGIVIGCNASGAGVTDAVGGQGASWLAASRPVTGAWLRYQYHNGVLTTVPLWPWPMNERIKAAMVTSGYSGKGGVDGRGGIDLTQTVLALQ